MSLFRGTYQLKAAMLSAAFLVFGNVALGNPYGSIGLNWNNFVFEPLEREETPNYYGYGGRGSFGYSVRSFWDLGLYGHYAPGRLDTAGLGKESARLIHYGAETSVRFANTVYLGLRGGSASYQLSKQVEETEVPGKWSGIMGQASVGLILPIGKTGCAWHTLIDIGQASLKAADDPAVKTRTLSHVSLTLAFVYNGRQTATAGSGVFNNWIRGL